MSRAVSDFFSGSTTKIIRAKTLIAEFHTETANFAATNPITSVIVVHDDGRTINMRVDVKGVPPHISAIFGDMIHNLRAALDMAACELVRAAGRSDKRVYFPFSDDETCLPEMIKNKNFHRAGPMAVALLKSLRPYRCGDISLRAIHDLDIQDKHHKLIPVGQSYCSPIWKMVEKNGRPAFEVVGEPVISNYALVFPPDCALPGKLIIPTFKELVELVEGIIAAFRKLASDPTFPGAAPGPARVSTN
jgi:hypothetical protein